MDKGDKVKIRIYFFAILMFITTIIFAFVDHKYLIEIILVQGFLGIFSIAEALYDKFNQKQQ
jgi:hypothetical protein